MVDKSERPKGRYGVLSSLNMSIDSLNSAKEVTSMAPVKAALTSASALLTMIRDSMINEVDYVELGLVCASVCETLNRGMDRRQADRLTQPVLKAIEKLTVTMDGIRRDIIKRSKRNAISRRYYEKDDKEAIATWRLDLNRIRHVFNTELGINIPVTISDTHGDAVNKHTAVSDTTNAETTISDVRSDATNTSTNVPDIHRSKLKSHEGADGQNQATHASAPGESLPPLQRNMHGVVSDTGRGIISEVQGIVSDIRHMLKGQEGADGRHRSTQYSVPGELPPPPPRVFFGRDELIEKIVRFAELLAPVALIGAGGIGKTSIVLTVLHDDRIKQRFGDNRWFIRCDQFPASRTHFLRRLSKVIGADVENPEDLAPLRRYLSSKEMLIVLDNAESVLDLQGPKAQEIYTVVDELIRFSNICFCITSRISTVPPGCEILEIPTLSIEAAWDTFYQIYSHVKRSDPINGILEQLDFHPLSITLLATVAQHNKWEVSRLIREWEAQRTGVLHAQHSKSLAATVELSLASPMFQELGPVARGLLEVVAFFPQGVNEANIGWLFPALSDGPNMFDKFCILSLTYRSSGFVTMLAPLRDYLRPKDPTSSPLLGTTKQCYFTRLSARIHPNKPDFEESRWITLEDVNVEHLLDVFTSADVKSANVWDACARFMDHLYWHKPRLIILGPKIEALPDDHPSKVRCLQRLSWLFQSVGNLVERKRILTHTLKFWRERGDDYQVAIALSDLSGANYQMDLLEEGIEQAEEASQIFERLGDTTRQAGSLVNLAWALHDAKQLDAAEEVASRTIDLLPEKGEQLRLCGAHRVLGGIYDSKGDTQKAVHHLEVALGIASSLNWHNELFWIHFALAEVFLGEGRLNDADTHIECARSHAVDEAYLLARVMDLQARFWAKQCMFGEAKSEALHALDVFERLGAANDMEDTIWLLGRICRDARGMDSGPVIPDEVAPDEPGDDEYERWHRRLL